MKNNKKIIIIGIVTLILIIAIITTTIIILNKDNSSQKEATPKIEIIDEMKDYDYYLEETATDYYKKLYNELKNILNEDKINEQEYAKIVSQLFVTDLFTLDNKITSNNIGGLQFIHTDFKDDFINIAKTTIYSTVESNIYGDRKQELPIVSNTEITNIENGVFIYKDEEYDSYEISLSIEYKKDLDYPKEYNLILIHNGKYLQIAQAE